jgi:hypothetical protein
VDDIPWLGLKLKRFEKTVHSNLVSVMCSLAKGFSVPRGNAIWLACGSARELVEIE